MNVPKYFLLQLKYYDGYLLLARGGPVRIANPIIATREKVGIIKKKCIFFSTLFNKRLGFYAKENWQLRIVSVFDYTQFDIKI